ncbi:adhesive plaque matrix protein-like [Daphnia carinata]|uniref:adhesive plaque matrix protein-like n=1 Tax=Daphnia carinata TaxID=120202 RepID=UPI00257E3EAA|nr:adhesive plaque matrix protein-like [Daphnia carinata]
MFARVLICVAQLIAQAYSYGYQPPAQPNYYPQPAQPHYNQPIYQQPSYTTAKPYYTTTAKPYYTTTAEPYYPTTTYPTTPYYTTTYPTTSYYTTSRPTYEKATTSYYQQPTYYTTTKAYYVQPSYTPAYYPDNYDAKENGWYNYAFKFNVNDYGNEQSRSETHENSVTRGQYTVSLPDGRKQIVNYEADQNGYRAEVSYEPAGSNQYSDMENYYSTSKYGSSQYDYQTTPAYINY